MPVQIQYQTNGICVLRITRILKRSEFGAEQSALARHIDTGSQPRLLVILENFEGWECASEVLSFWRTRAGAELVAE